MYMLNLMARLDAVADIRSVLDKENVYIQIQSMRMIAIIEKTQKQGKFSTNVESVIKSNLEIIAI